ncbi:MAG: terminase [Muribaculaceae bacterium]|nr:terminase [Muribaculaceae bacterium]MDE6753318.1 terminase [Muribaculaceae bacterium]
MNSLPYLSSEIKELLKENAIRNNRVKTPYDPIKGDPHDGPRFHLILDDLDCWIPESMRNEKLVKNLLEYGSWKKYMQKAKTDSYSDAQTEFFLQWNALRALHDFPFWAASYAHIKCKGGGNDLLFKLNHPQRRLVETLEQMRRNNLPIRLILLKARQWGGSTCVQMYMAWLQLVHEKGLNSLIIAHQGCATDEIKDMFDRMILQYPEEMLLPNKDQEAARKDSETGTKKRVQHKRMERVGGSGAAFRVLGRNCKIKIGSAERPNSCRGGDYNLIHCSEVALWPSSRLKTPEALHRAATAGVLFKPLTMILMESTANGTGNFFHKEYEAAKSGTSQFKALFIPWFEIEQYSVPMQEEELAEFAGKLIEGRNNEHSVSDRQQPGAYLWRLWEMGASLEAINWYVKERSKYSDHGLMASEYPSDDVEAFVHSGARVFDKYCVEKLRPDCQPPLMRGEIDGDAPSGEKSLSNVRFSPADNGALAIWKDRSSQLDERVADRYLVVVDIGGRSRNSDWSVITVFDRIEMSYGGKPEVAAQWRGHTDFDLLAWNAARIATYFDEALLVIESNTIETHEPGHLDEADQSAFLLNQIREAYPNLYARRRSENDIKLGQPVKYGFHTNVSTKPMVISTLVKVIREGLYVERDEQCLAEYLTYEQRQNGSYAAIQGYHDDMLMTRAIGLHICFQEMKPPRVYGSDFSCCAHPSRRASPFIF